jgi:hypothetical protein
MEAHEGDLRAIALTADGTKLATASIKGTVIRVWDVASSTCLQEFRRGVERTTITCLAWSWDCEWLSCTSDKGTAHIFQINEAKSQEEKGKDSGSLTRMLFSSVRKSVEGEARKSVCQIRGVPHPQACSFCSEAPNMIAVAGWDADGNGVLLLSEFSANEEPRRVGYHVLCKSAFHNETEEARRRRRLRGWTPEIPQTPEGGRLYIGERLEVLEKGMEQIRFDEEDEFVSVTRVDSQGDEVNRQGNGEQSAANLHHAEDASKGKSQSNQTAAVDDPTDHGNSNRDLGIGSDSVTTEPLDDESNHPSLNELHQ